MFLRRCIYYMPKQTQKEYWERQWSRREIDRLVAGGPQKAWWPVLCELAGSLAADDLILEAGCGLGQFVHLLAERGHRVMGVDVAQHAVARAREAFPGLELQVQDVRDLDLPDASVAMYISLGVVEHLPEGPDAILREASRVVADGGILFITVPYLNLYRRLREPWWRLKFAIRRSGLFSRLTGRGAIEFYQYAFGPRQFTGTLRRHGFEPKQTLLHHSHVALTKDLGEMRWFRRRYAHPKDFDRLDTKRIRALADRLDRSSPRLMSHMMLVVARRRARASSAASSSSGSRDAPPGREERGEEEESNHQSQDQLHAPSRH